jgi:hypothetical protein
VCHVDCVCTVKQTFDLAQLKNKGEIKMAELKFFNALINSVVGNDEEKKSAKEYLAEVDPEVWGDSPD